MNNLNVGVGAKADLADDFVKTPCTAKVHALPTENPLAMLLQPSPQGFKGAALDFSWFSKTLLYSKLT